MKEKRPVALLADDLLTLGGVLLWSQVGGALVSCLWWQESMGHPREELAWQLGVLGRRLLFSGHSPDNLLLNPEPSQADPLGGGGGQIPSAWLYFGLCPDGLMGGRSVCRA